MCLVNIDLTSSVGSGGRSWSSIGFNVQSSAPSVSQLESFLNKSYTFSPPSPIPHKYLQSGYSYSFTVTLCNFLGACTQSSHFTTVINILAPSISFLGSSLRIISSYQPLVIESQAVVNDCNGGSSNMNLIYEWSISLGDLVLPTLSQSRNPSIFKLSSHSLTPKTTYTVSLRAFDTSTLRSFSSSIDVYVQSSAITAEIQGSDVRTISLYAPYSLDGSSSHDLDQTNFGRFYCVFVCCAI